MITRRASFPLWIVLSAACIPVVRGAEITLVPIHATVPHQIDGNEITLLDSGATVTLELRVSGWDPDLDGVPRLSIYQVDFDFSSYRDDPVQLAALPCSQDSDCFGGSSCQATGVCDGYAALYVDQDNPEFVFSGLPAIGVADVVGYFPRVGAVLFSQSQAVTDTGEDRYGATLILDVADDLLGTITVGFTRGGFVDENQEYIQPLDLIPAAITVVADCNVNGVSDTDDISIGESDDCNGNGRPDECEADCNKNGIADGCDTTNGFSEDCNENDVPDECEPDCNENGEPDGCDVMFGLSDDCNLNKLPDECETGGDQDCNQNRRPDLCDLFEGVDQDCNSNRVLDSCDILAGVSEDCTGNDTPDECEPDCNRNCVADSCDIGSGISKDSDGDEIPDECVRGLALVPVTATVAHTIVGSEIVLPMGGATVTFEVRVSGWDPYSSGDPLRGVVAQIDRAGLRGGDNEPLSLAAIPCSSNTDCVPGSVCLADGRCDEKSSAFINPTHPDFIFAGLHPVYVVDLYGSAIRWEVALIEVGVDDPGIDRYAGTLQVEVSPVAAGTFSIEFIHDQCQLVLVRPAEVRPEEVRPGFITVLADCNDNGIRDDIELLDSTESDLDGNGILDDCEFAVPAVSSDAAHSITASPSPGQDEVALQVTSPQFPCLESYVFPAGTYGLLADRPVYLTPATWGQIRIVDPKIVRGATYEVQAVLRSGYTSEAVGVTTPWWRTGGRWVLDDGQTINPASDGDAIASMNILSRKSSATRPLRRP